jgi:hypothetical protein
MGGDTLNGMEENGGVDAAWRGIVGVVGREK